jgi:VanZ family protein
MLSGMTRHKQYIYYHFPWQLMAVVLFVLSSISGEDLSAYTFEVSDKLIHFMVFGILGVLMFRSFKISSRIRIRKNAFSFAVLAAIIYGGLDELHQLFVPGRFASIGDWIADILGILIMILLYRWLTGRISIYQNTGNLDKTGR